MRFLLAFLLCLSLATPVHAGASRSWDGTDDEMTVGTNLNVTTGSFSTCFWANLTEDATSDWIGGKKNSGGGTTDAGYGIRESSTDVIDLRINDATDAANCSVADPDGAWTSLCFTWTGGSDDTCQGYKNGVAGTPVTNTLVGSLSNAVEYQMGEDVLNADDMTGNTAYGSVYLGKVLTQQEVSELMWKPYSIVDSLSAAWPLWGSNSPEIDLSGNGLDATIVAGTAASTDGPPVMIGDAPL